MAAKARQEYLDECGICNDMTMDGGNVESLKVLSTQTVSRTNLGK